MYNSTKQNKYLLWTIQIWEILQQEEKHTIRSSSVQAKAMHQI